jgi:hypothetical protein
MRWRKARRGRSGSSGLRGVLGLVSMVVGTIRLAVYRTIGVE